MAKGRHSKPIAGLFPNPFEQSVVAPKFVELNKIQTQENKKLSKESPETKIKISPEVDDDMEAMRDDLNNAELDPSSNDREKNKLLDKVGVSGCACEGVYGLSHIPPAHRLLCRLALNYIHVHVLALLLNVVFNVAAFEVAQCVGAVLCLGMGVPYAWIFQHRRLQTALSAGMNAELRLMMCAVQSTLGVLFNIALTTWTFLRSSSIQEHSLRILLFVCEGVSVASLVTSVVVCGGVVRAWYNRRTMIAQSENNSTTTTTAPKASRMSIDAAL